MPQEESSLRIKFAYRLKGWKFESGSKAKLISSADRVQTTEYTKDMKGEIFCPGCFTNLNKVPEDKDYLRNGRKAHFSHLRKYRHVTCDLRSQRTEGKRYETHEEAQQAIDNESLVIVSGFLQTAPEPATKTQAGPYVETPVEDENGPDSKVPLGRHNGETFSLPSKITTIAGMCRNFDVNLYKYYHLPDKQHAIRLIDLLHNIEDVEKEDIEPKFYYGWVKRSYCTVENPTTNNVRMTELRCNNSVKDFYLKASNGMSERKGINDDTADRIVIMYGNITSSGIGLCVNNPHWGEFALLPEEYNYLLDN